MKKKPTNKIKGRALSKKRAVRPYTPPPINSSSKLAIYAGLVGTIFGQVLGSMLKDPPAAGQDPVITEDAEFTVVEPQQLPQPNSDL